MSARRSTPSAAPAGSRLVLADTTVASLVASAGLAPSPDNNQPWAFRPAGDSILVLHVRARAVKSDCLDLFSWLALGAAIENLVLSASMHGLRAETSFEPRPYPRFGGDEHVATVRVRGDTTADRLGGWIARRTTNRRPYERRVPDAEARAELAAQAGARGLRVDWLTTGEEIGEMARLVGMADRIRFELRAFHDELHGVLRYDGAQASRTRDGLDVRTFEMPWPMAGVLRWLRPWRRMRCMNRFGLSLVFGAVSARQVRASGALALLTAAQASDRRFLDAGRGLERFWLAATARGLATQPLGAVPLFLLKSEREPEVFRREHVDRLRSVRSTLGRLAPGAAGGVPVMLFRVGTAPAPSARSLRYDVSRIRREEDAE